MVQGLTEFLPISSSGHLVFFQFLFGLEKSQLFFDVMLHLGTLFAVLIYLRTDISKIVQGVLLTLMGKEKGNPNWKLFLLIILATIPTGLIGIIFRDWFETLFFKPRVVGIMLLITGLVLWLTHYTKKTGKTIKKMGWMDSILIGMAQGLAIIPGISRSGATISTGLFCGLEREFSGKFSFLLSIPAVLGATLLEFRKVESSSEVWIGLVGMATAFCVGLVALKFLMKIIRKGKLFIFSYYCWGMGILMIILIQ